MTQIFISHARVDARLASQVERTLTGWRIVPWVDRQQLAGGQDWPLMLQQAIDQSDALIIVMTPAALASAMVQREYRYAQSRGITVLLLHFKPVVKLPAELARAPGVTYRGNRLVIGATFYTLLEDLGLLSPPRDDQLGALEPADILHLYAQRNPPDWQVYSEPKAVSWRSFGTLCVMFVAMLAGNQLLAQWYPTIGTLVTLIPLLLLFALFLSLPFIVMATMHLNIALGRLPQDHVVLAPDHCTVQILMFEHRRITTLPLCYPYHRVQAATWHMDRWGRAIVTLTPVGGGAQARIVLPRRWAQRRVIAKQMIAVIMAFRQVHSLDAINAAPIAPIPAPKSAPQAATVGTYCLIAATIDQALLRVIQLWLAARGLMQDDLVLSGEFILPTAAAAARSRFALFVATPAVAHSPQCGAIIADLQRQGKLVIPIRTERTVALPAHFAALQWVDFGPRIDRTRSFLDLCDTLDRTNALPLLPGGQFDAELALARATHERVPAGWSAFKPDTSVQTQYRLRQIIGPAIPILIGALLVVAPTSEVLSSYVANDPFSATVIAEIAIFVLAGLFALFLWPMRAAFAQFRFLGRLLSGAAAPECVVIAPEGIAFHVVAANSSRFVDGGYAFTALQSLKIQIGPLGSPKLRIVPKQGKPVAAPLTYFGSFTDTIITLAQAAWERRGNDAVRR